MFAMHLPNIRVCICVHAHSVFLVHYRQWIITSGDGPYSVAEGNRNIKGHIIFGPFNAVCLEKHDKTWSDLISVV